MFYWKNYFDRVFKNLNRASVKFRLNLFFLKFSINFVLFRLLYIFFFLNSRFLKIKTFKFMWNSGVVYFFFLILSLIVIIAIIF